MNMENNAYIYLFCIILIYCLGIDVVDASLIANDVYEPKC